MELSLELTKILKSELRWTPKAFEHFKVTFDSSRMHIPLWRSGCRTYDFQKKGKSRMKNPYGFGASLFGNKDYKDLILVEGEWDLFAAFETGISNVITGTNGATTFNESMAAEVKGKNIFVVYDNDEAGTKGALKATQLLKKHNCSVKSIKLPNEVGAGGDVRDYFTKLLNFVD